MSGFQIPHASRVILPSGPVAMPVVDRSLLLPRPKAPPVKKTAQTEAEEGVRIVEEGIILPRPVRPIDFDTSGALTLRLLLRVCEHATGIPATAIQSQRRNSPVVKARQIYMWLCKRFTSRSFPQIGALVGGRDHTTVMHGYRKAEAAIAALGIEVCDDSLVMAERLWLADWSEARR